MQKLLNQKLIDSGDLDESEDEDDTDSSSVAATPAKKPNPQKKTPRPRSSMSMVQSPPQSATSTPIAKSAKSQQSFLTALRKKLLSLHEYMLQYTVNGRQPMGLFIEKPSKKLYPDYYQVIQHPIDMTTIENNIKSDRYGVLDDAVGDYRLMFSNCRKYNEEGSMIYEDANILEKALNEKLKEFSGINKRFSMPKSA